MYIIAIIKDNIVYWSNSKVFMNVENAKKQIAKFPDKKGIQVYEIMDLKLIRS